MCIKKIQIMSVKFWYLSAVSIFGVLVTNVGMIKKPLIKKISEFAGTQMGSSFLLFGCVIIALIIANSPLSHAYHHFWEEEFAIGFKNFQLNKSLHHWINDGLMAVFFFVVGLELKREIIAGELSKPSQAILPVIAAIGGMLMPALIYLLIDHTDETYNGWGIPMATDIAFVLGILALAGKNVPVSIKIFLTALAIVDDLGAVLVIALFYTSDISLLSLGIGAGFLAVMIGGNLLGVRSTFFYALFGIGGLWTAFLLSGVHATIAGVLAAFTIPMRTKIDKNTFIEELQGLLQIFKADTGGRVNTSGACLLSNEEIHHLDEINELSLKVTPPLQKLEHTLHPLVSFVIMPIFALANAGVEIPTENLAAELLHPVTFGVLTGLLLGKFLGVFGTVYLACKFKIGSLPAEISYGHLAGMGLLAGVGFTMSLFINNLAFTDKELVESAQLGVLLASLTAGVSGFVLIKRFSNPPASHLS